MKRRGIVIGSHANTVKHVRGLFAHHFSKTREE